MRSVLSNLCGTVGQSLTDRVKTLNTAFTAFHRCPKHVPRGTPDLVLRRQDYDRFDVITASVKIKDSAIGGDLLCNGH